MHGMRMQKHAARESRIGATAHKLLPQFYRNSAVNTLEGHVECVHQAFIAAEAFLTISEARMEKADELDLKENQGE